MRIYKSTRLVQGVGVKGDNRTTENGVMVQSYKTWTSLLQRCYSDTHHITHPTYKNCTVCDEWLHYGRFKAWFDVNHREGWQIDKDMMVEGNKLYSPENCRYIPQGLNKMFLNISRGDLPVGVYKNRCGTSKNPYAAKIFAHGKQCYVGVYETAQEAHTAYLKFKKSYCTKEVNRYKANGDIDQELYLILIRKIANLK